MELERRYSVLAVSASLKFVETLRTLLPEGRYGPVTVLHDTAAARRALAENSYDLVLINTPLPDEFGTRLALDACESSTLTALCSRSMSVHFRPSSSPRRNPVARSR